MSAELAIVTALIAVSGFMMWISFRYNDSEEWSLGVLSQLFHGFAIVLWLPIMYSAYEFSLGMSAHPNLQNVLAPVLAILGVLLFVYAMLMIIRVVWGIIKSAVSGAARLAGFNADVDENSKIKQRRQF